MSKIVLVIPCYNEAERFLPEQAEQLLVNDQMNLLLVNDGSTDQTLMALQDFKSNHQSRVEVLNLDRNLGKAEAVRLGLKQAIDQGAKVTGYFDADFATPSEEMLRLTNILASSPNTQVLLGARWLHLGAEIERNVWRHYGGRIFATLASAVLGLKVYDTQCGAKLFRVNAALQSSLGENFVSPWAFDVELLGRLKLELNQDEFREVPLSRWLDVAGSKISFMDMVSATLALYNIHRALKRQRYSNSRAGHQGKNSGMS